MHVTLKSQNGPQQAIMCVERDAQTCLILKGDYGEVVQLTNMARAMGVHRIAVITTNPRLIEQLSDMGWFVSTQTILEKDLNNGA